MAVNKKLSTSIWVTLYGCEVIICSKDVPPVKHVTIKTRSGKHLTTISMVGASLSDKYVSKYFMNDDSMSRSSPKLHLRCGTSDGGRKNESADDAGEEFGGKSPLRL